MRLRVFFFACIFVLGTAALYAQTELLTQVNEDARLLSRLAELARRDQLPQEILGRMIEQDLDVLRGRRDDGSFRYARYERMEERRESERFTLKPSKDQKSIETPVIKGKRIYQIILSVPSRRMLVSRNNALYVDRIEVTYTPFGGVAQTDTIEIKQTLTPATETKFDLPVIAASAEAIVVGRPEGESTATVDVALVEAALIDLPQSPYAAVVRDVKALRQAIERNKISDVRRLAESVAVATAGTARSEVDVLGNRIEPPRREPAAAPLTVQPATNELLPELQTIEDLLTGTEAERREGLDRLHQLVRRLRPTSTP